MAADWRVTECVNQLLLCAAFNARAAVLSRQGRRSQQPLPLPPFDQLLQRGDIQPVFVKVAECVSPLENFQRLVRWLCDLPNRPKTIAPLQEQPPWRIDEVVSWWIQAGLALADWDWDRSTTASPGLPNSHEGPADAAWPLTLIRRHLLLDDDEDHPAFWLARHAEEWRISADDLVEESVGPSNPAPNRETCLEALLAWCGDPTRELRRVSESDTPDDVDQWAENYDDRYRDFARAARHVLRRGCRFGDGRPVSLYRGDWVQCDMPQSPGRYRVLRRPLYCVGEVAARAVVTGLVVVPWPEVLVKQLAGEWQSRPNGSRALTRARVWTHVDRTFWPTPSSTGERRSGGECLRRAAERIAALASLAVIIPPERIPQGTEPATTATASSNVEDCLRRAWEMEGITVHWDPAGGVARLIPVASSLENDPTSTAGQVTLEHDGCHPGRFVVGEVGRIHDCPDDLLAEIEELDWRWWSVQVLRDMGRLPSHLVWLADGANDVAWEAQKRHLLAAGLQAAPHPFVVAHDALNPFRLRLERDAEAAGPLVTWLAEAVFAVEHLICRLLAEGAPDKVARVNPPRDHTGRISLQAWLPAEHGGRLPPAAWRVEWEPSSSPLGLQVREALDGSGTRRAAFSAGRQPLEADLRWLLAPGMVIETSEPAVDAFASRLRPWLRRSLGQNTPADLATEIARLREWCAGDGGDAFDQLIKAAIAGVPAAISWVSLLRDDARFEFACHPRVECTADAVQLLPAQADDPLEWEDHDSLDPGVDLTVRYATDAFRSRRVVSRGMPAADSADALASRLVAAVASGPSRLVEQARKARQATDRRRMFGWPMERVQGVVVAVGEALLTGMAELGDKTMDAWKCLNAWSAALGFTITPLDWHPTEGAEPEGLAVVSVDFHDTVPPGRVIVRRFGVTTIDGQEIVALDCAVSAGKPKAGYDDLRNLVAGLPGDSDEVIKVRSAVAGFPGRVRSGQDENSLKEIFDRAWKARRRHPEREDLQQVTEAVRRLAADAYGYAVFSPETLGGLPEKWLQTADGKEPQGPRGSRIDRVIRPGLRTHENKLVQPAIVEMGRR